MALKSARVVDFWGKSSGLADFKNTVDRGSAVIFDSDSGFGLSYAGFGSLVVNESWITDLSSALVEMLMSSSKLLMPCSTWKYCIKKGVLKKVLMFHIERKRDVSGITPSSVAKDAVDKSKR